MADNGDKLFLCSQECSTYEEASDTYLLGAVDLTVGDGNGDFTIADGTSGRKVTITAQTGIPITSSGTITHAVVADSANERVLGNKQLSSSQAVTSGQTVSTPAFALQIPDPS